MDMYRYAEIRKVFPLATIFLMAIFRMTFQFSSRLFVYQFIGFNQHSTRCFSPTSSDRQVLQDPIDIPQQMRVQRSAHCEIRFLSESASAASAPAHTTTIHRPSAITERHPDRTFCGGHTALIWSNIDGLARQYLWIILQLLTVY